MYYAFKNLLQRKENELLSKITVIVTQPDPTRLEANGLTQPSPDPNTKIYNQVAFGLGWSSLAEFRLVYIEFWLDMGWPSTQPVTAVRHPKKKKKLMKTELSFIWEKNNLKIVLVKYTTNCRFMFRYSSKWLAMTRAEKKKEKKDSQKKENT